jgi:hypothetical protein
VPITINVVLSITYVEMADQSRTMPKRFVNFFYTSWVCGMHLKQVIRGSGPFLEWEIS